MKIKIQRTEDSITLQEDCPEKSTCKKVIKDLKKVNGDFFELAQRFFECFPRYREITFNTELTD